MNATRIGALCCGSDREPLSASQAISIALFIIGGGTLIALTALNHIPIYGYGVGGGLLLVSLAVFSVARCRESVPRVNPARDTLRDLDPEFLKGIRVRVTLRTGESFYVILDRYESGWVGTRNKQPYHIAHRDMSIASIELCPEISKQAQEQFDCKITNTISELHLSFDKDALVIPDQYQFTITHSGKQQPMWTWTILTKTYEYTLTYNTQKEEFHASWKGRANA